MKKSIILAFVLSVILTGCLFVRVIHHSAPNLSVDQTPFTDLEALAAQIGCNRVDQIPATLGGLDPHVPIAYCIKVGSPGEDTQQGIFREGCMLAQWTSYVVFRSGTYSLLSTADEFKAAFAQITTPEEAISYAQAITGLELQFDLKTDLHTSYQQRVLEDSYAKTSGDGYDVLMFDKQFCGCGPHTLYQVIVHVSKAGDVTIGEKLPLFDDPAMKGMCVD
jgi:hypothetical protein